VASGPVLIAFDGTDAAEHALRESAAVLSERRALVLVVYKVGLGFELVEPPTSAVGLPPAPIDIRAALEIDDETAEGAQRTAHRGAQIASEVGFEADGLAVADEVETPVAETIVTVAEERDAATIVIGAHGHGRIAAILGSTSRDVIRNSTRPVLVARKQPAD
jgi:nucleotide-binding universal stress UspA family protein